VHCKYIPIYIQQNVTLHSLFISGNYSTCFGRYHPKHVEQFPDINKLCNLASCWIYIGILLGTHTILHISRIRVNRRLGVPQLWPGCSLGEERNPLPLPVIVPRFLGFRVRRPITTATEISGLRLTKRRCVHPRLLADNTRISIHRRCL
jgi:hypothetical protein